MMPTTTPVPATVLFILCSALGFAADSQNAPYTMEATVQSLAADRSQLAVHDSQPNVIVTVNDAALKEALKNWNPGDQGKLTLLKTGANTVLQEIARKTVQPTTVERILALALPAFALLGFTFVLSNRNTMNLLFVGEDNRLSNSKVQLSLWFGVLVSSYIATLYLRRFYGGPSFLGNVEIPAHLAMVSGISALTFASAKGITTAKVSGAQNAKTKADKPRLSDLLKDDNGNFDLGDFQMLIFTLLAIGVYLFQIFDFLGAIELRTSITLPDVDSTILAAFGLGQGAYLTKKAVGGVAQ